MCTANGDRVNKLKKNPLYEMCKPNTESYQVRCQLMWAGVEINWSAESVTKLDIFSKI